MLPADTAAPPGSVGVVSMQPEPADDKLAPVVFTVFLVLLQKS